MTEFDPLQSAYIANEHPSDTVDTIVTDVVDALKKFFQEEEKKTLQANLDAANAQLEPLREQADAAQAALEDFSKKSLYQRSVYNAYPRLNSIPANQQAPLRSLISRHEQIMTSLLQQGQYYNELMAQGNNQGASGTYSNMDRTCYNYTVNNKRTRATYAVGKELGNYGMPIPYDAYSIIREAKRISALETKLQGDASAASGTAATAAIDVDAYAQTLASGNFDLRRQAEKIDGTTPQELATLDKILEESVNLGIPFTLDEVPMRTGMRVTRDADSITAKMTEKEFAQLAKSVSEAVAQSDGTSVNVTARIHDVLASNEPLGSIYAKSVDAANEPQVSALASDIASALERAEDIGHARMIVSFETQGQKTIFTVRMRNPGEQTFVEAFVRSDDGFARGRAELLTHPDGLADVAWEFALTQQYNGSVLPVEFRMYADETGGELLDIVRGTYDVHGNRFTLLTEQPAWDEREEGRLEAVPIEPTMSVSEITGPNVLLALQSPHDQTVLTFESGGYLDTQRVTHEDGTPFAMARVTFNASKPSGTYVLKMYDRANGMVLDTIQFRWDAGGRQLSLANEGDAFAGPGADEQREALEGYADTFDRVNALSSAYLDNVQCTRIFQDRLYREMQYLPAPYNAFHFEDPDLDRLIYQLHPEYAPENFEAEVDRRWTERFPTFARADVARWLYDERVMFMTNAHRDLEYYSKAMMNLMQQTADSLMQLRQGGNQAEQTQRISDAINYASGAPLQQANKIQATHIGYLKGYGISLPNADMMFKITREVMDRIWTEVERLQYEVVQYREYLQRLGEGPNPMRINADGELVPISPYTREETQDLDRSAVARAQKIQNFIDDSDDPRIRALRQSEKNEIALQIGAKGIIEATPENQLVIDDIIQSVVDKHGSFHNQYQELQDFLHNNPNAGDANSFADSIVNTVNSNTQETEIIVQEGLANLRQDYFVDIDVTTTTVADASNQSAFIENDKRLYRAIYDGIQSSLTEIHTSIDSEIGVFNAEIEKISNELNKYPQNAIQWTYLQASLRTLQAGVGSLKALKFVVPETPVELGVEMAMTATGIRAMKYAPKALVSVLTKIDNVAGTTLSTQFVSKLDTISEGATALLQGVEARVCANLELMAWDKIPGHMRLQHVGISMENLYERLIKEGKKTVSTFTDYKIANDIFKLAQKANIEAFEKFVRGEGADRLEFEFTSSNAIGYGVKKVGDTITEYSAKRAKFILLRHELTHKPFLMTVELFQ